MKKKRTVKKIILFIVAAIIIVVPSYIKLTGYINSLPKHHYEYNTSSISKVEYPNSKFAVISDLHYYDNSLGITGKAFEDCYNSDRKLLKDSADLLNMAVDEISKSDSQFVFVTGDMTKDGELICHQKVAAALNKLKQSGKKIFVIPGNHDINNPLAYKYSGDKSIPVANINADKFVQIYNDFGFSSAIYRDKNSLSYVAEPVKNLWIVALDTCSYKYNQPGKEEIVGSILSQGEVNWVEYILKKAQKNGKSVILLSHHGIVEHWDGQAKLHPEYLIQDYKRFSKLVASYNVRIAFTGHYHAQDITKGDFGTDGSIYDIETGSLITAPCSIRYCSIDNNQLKINSTFIVDKLHPGMDYAKNAKQFVHDAVKKEAVDTLKKYFVTGKDGQYIADYIASGFTEHYKGDENVSDRPAFDESKLSLWSRFIYSQEKYVVKGLWKDLYPADNNVVLDLNKD